MDKTIFLDATVPFRLDLTAWALRRRPNNRMDWVEGGIYSRVFAFADDRIEVRAIQQEPSQGARLAVHLGGPGVMTKARQAEIVSTIEKMLGLHVDLTEFYAMARRDPHLGPLVERFHGLKPPRFPTLFEALVNGIACQQLSLNVGILLLNRLCEACGPSMRTESGRFRHAFPRPEDMLLLEIEDFRRMGFSTRKAEFLLDLAHVVAEGRLDLEGLLTVRREKAVETFDRLRGIGRWTTEYVLLRGIGDLSRFPGDDVGGRNRLQRLLGLQERLTYETVSRITAKWQPYSGFVYFHLLLDELSREGQLEIQA